jgi:uncharacterized membrane protein YkvA (DUF1232 family)
MRRKEKPARPKAFAMAAWMRTMKIRTWALSYACRDPETPWYAKAWAALVVAYAVSPIDLIPDFIPVLGMLDDIILVPLGIAIALRLIPRHVMDRALVKARAREAEPGRSRWIVAVVILAAWATVIALVLLAILRQVRQHRG